MRRLAFLLAGLVLLLSGCGGAPAPTGGSDASDRDAEIYAEVLRKLVTVDHTFDSGSSPFDRVFILNGTVEGSTARAEARAQARHSARKCGRS